MSKYIKTYKRKIQYNQNENFELINFYDYFLCLITNGYVILEINTERCYILPGVLLCFNKSDHIKLIAKKDLKAESISFDAEFINVNLNWSVIENMNYSLLRKQHNYPILKIFTEKTETYNGIIPLLSETLKPLLCLFNVIIFQIKEQPDQIWSCRSRANLFTILDIADFFCDEMKTINKLDNPMQKILDYIHVNINEDLRIDALCKKFTTNHSCLSMKFKAFTGITIAQYIITHRIELAKKALAFTDLSLNEIAQIYGFKRLQYMVKCFNDRVGLTPLKYRNTMRDARMKQ